MREEVIDIVTADGAMETFVCRPERGGPYPPVLLLMDAPGIRDELHDMARRLATVGYFVMLPNLYYRAGRDTKYGPDVLDPASPDDARMRAVRTKTTIPPVMADVGVLLDHAARHAEATDGPAGAHGYCMSGPYALAAAARYPQRIAAAASFHGTWLVSDAEESPHLTFAKSRAELYISCAEHDEVTSRRRARRARSRSIPACTMASPSPSGGATTSSRRNATGSGSSRCIGAAWGEAARAHGIRNWNVRAGTTGGQGERLHPPGRQPRAVSPLRTRSPPAGWTLPASSSACRSSSPTRRAISFVLHVASRASVLRRRHQRGGRGRFRRRYGGGGDSAQGRSRFGRTMVVIGMRISGIAGQLMRGEGRDTVGYTRIVHAHDRRLSVARQISIYLTGKFILRSGAHGNPLQER